jgi:uncharacterized membrane protein
MGEPTTPTPGGSPAPNGLPAPNGSPRPAEPWMTPERFRLVVSTVLIVGVTLSGALTAVALVAALVVGWSTSLLGAPAISTAPSDFSQIGAGLLALRPIAIAQLGVLVLLATPVMRVVASVVGFALEGDRLYVGITLVVLTVLLLSIFVIR